MYSIWSITILDARHRSIRTPLLLILPFTVHGEDLTSNPYGPLLGLKNSRIQIRECTDELSRGNACSGGTRGSAEYVVEPLVVGRVGGLSEEKTVGHECRRNLVAFVCTINTRVVWAKEAEDGGEDDLVY